MKRSRILDLCLICALIAVRADAKKLRVVTTLPSLASLAESVGGEWIQVESISKGAQDAHYVEAKPSYMLKLNKADLLIYSGLELEIGWLPLLIQGARNPDVSVGAKGNLNASTALSEDDIVERPRGGVDRSMGDVHPLGNPHYLLDPRNAIPVSERIAEKLSELDPAHQAQYMQNAADFQAVLQLRISEWEGRFAAVREKKVVSYHPHWSYLLNWMSIQNAGFIELRPGIPPSPKHKKEIIDLIQSQGIGVIIISTWTEPTPAREVAQTAQANLLILPGEVQSVPEARTYTEFIQCLVEGAASAFSKSSGSGGSL